MRAVRPRPSMSHEPSFELCVSIIRWALDDQPGWVECLLMDAHGRPWFFLEKAPVVSGEDLRADTMYPCPGRIACHVIERRVDASDKPVLVVDTARPWGIEATSGETRFDVRPDQVVSIKS